MPTLIDSFLVEVGLDPSGYQKGAKDVGASFAKTKESARVSAKEMESYGKQSSAFFGKLKTEALGLFLAFAGASSIKALVGNLLDGDASAGRLAKNLGLATQSVSAYRMVVKSLGGEAGDADNTLGLLASARESLRLTGQTGHDAELMRLGVTKEDLQDPLVALEKIAKTGETMKREDYFAVLTRLGIPPGAIESLNHGRDGLHRLIEAKRADGAATDEDARKAQEFQAALSSLESKITGAIRPAVYSLVTAATELFDQFQAGKLVISDATPVLVAIGIAAGVAGAPFVALAAAIAVVVVNLGRLKQAWRDFEAWHDSLQKGTDGFFDPIRHFFGLKTGAEARAAGTDSFGNPRGGGRGPEALAPRLGHMAGAPSAGGSGPEGPAPRLEHMVGQAFQGVKAMIMGHETGSSRHPYDTVVYGLPSPKPLTSMTMGQVFDFQRGALRAQTQGYPSRRDPRGIGSSGVGAYQFESLTLRGNAQALFGQNWRNQLFSAANQDALAERNYNVAKANGTLATQWAAFAPGAQRAVARRSGSGSGGSIHIGAIHVNAPNANPNAVADKVPAAIRARLSLSQGNQGLLG